MPRENDLEGAQDQGGKHGGQKGMPKPEPRHTTRRSQGAAMHPIKVSCAMSADRSSRGTRSGRSKSAEQIPSNGESSDRAFSLASRHYAAHSFAAQTKTAPNRKLPGWDASGRLAWLVGRVVPWHNFNLVGFAC